ncbi:MAG: class I SAM-dependent methyltransferase [Gammaproteobacteria bacterium]|nr:class I SAM-dependent methyltransferase [Gammaproteobacteria bacterium]
MSDLQDYSQKIRNDLKIHSEWAGFHLDFYTTWGLFSPRSIDDGSKMLLRYLDIKATDDCLDMGCGYGVLGLNMAKAAPEGQTLLVDKDFVAVEYSEKNRQVNKIENASCLLSNGFKQIPKQQFDIIVSNIPAKVGKEMLYIYLFDALDYLKPGGSFYIVTITGLRQFFKRGFNEVFGHYEKIKQGKTYTVARGIKAG